MPPGKVGQKSTHFGSAGAGASKVAPGNSNGARRLRFSLGGEAEKEEAEFVEAVHGDGQGDHAVGVGRGDEAGHDDDDHAGDFALAAEGFELDNADAAEEEDDERGLEHQAEDEAEHECKIDKVGQHGRRHDPDVGGRVVGHRGVEGLAEIGEATEGDGVDEKIEEEDAGEEEQEAEGAVDADEAALARLEGGADEGPDLVKNPRGGENEAGDEGDHHQGDQGGVGRGGVEVEVGRSEDEEVVAPESPGGKGRVEDDVEQFVAEPDVADDGADERGEDGQEDATTEVVEVLAKGHALFFDVGHRENLQRQRKQKRQNHKSHRRYDCNRCTLTLPSPLKGEG